MNAGAQPAARPRPSATVVLLRDTGDGPQVLLVLRHADASFGASYVFPGGVSEAVDQAVASHASHDDAALSRRLGLDAGGLAYFSAAIRELFEETGVLLARPAGEGRLIGNGDTGPLRAALNDGTLAWPELLARSELSLACDRLHYFAYWVTPRAFDKRYSTRFFLARAPDGQQARHDGGELTDSRWLRPADALAQESSGAMSLPPPTRATLKQLRRFDCVDAAMDWAQGCEAGGVDCLLPAILDRSGERRIVLPGSPDYPADHEGCES